MDTQLGATVRDEARGNAAALSISDITLINTGGAYDLTVKATGEVIGRTHQTGTGRAGTGGWVGPEVNGTDYDGNPRKRRSKFHSRKLAVEAFVRVANGGDAY
jgi:hypothetical protein